MIAPWLLERQGGFGVGMPGLTVSAGGLVE